jgi:hypothetical protein
MTVLPCLRTKSNGCKTMKVQRFHTAEFRKNIYTYKSFNYSNNDDFGLPETNIL